MSNTNTEIPLHPNALQHIVQGRLDLISSPFNLALDRPAVPYLEAVDICDKQVNFFKSALKDPQQSAMDQAILSIGFAYACFDRFQTMGVVDDLDKTIEHLREVLQGGSEGHEDPSASLVILGGHGNLSRDKLLNDLAHCLYTRFKHQGMLSDLQEAFQFHSTALELRQPGHPDRAATLTNLALCHSSQFDQLHVQSDLETAIRFLYNAKGLLPPNHPDQSTVLLTLGDCFYSRFESTRPQDVVFLNNAIEFYQDALLQEDNRAWPYASSGLARSLYTRFKVLKVDTDLEKAISLEHDIILRCPNCKFIRPKSCHNLGNCLLLKFHQSKNLKDLNEAIKYYREALELRPLGHPDRPISLSHLAKCLHVRSKHSHLRKQTDLCEAFKLYSLLEGVSQKNQVVFLQDVHAAVEWVTAAEEVEHRTTISAYQTLFRLLVNHLATLPSLIQHFDQLKTLVSTYSMDAFSACLRCGSAVDAVELLEQGRAVFWALLSRMHSPLDEVAKFGDTGKDLIEEFTQLAGRLRSASRHDEAWDPNARLREVVFKIRRLVPGFLLPPCFIDLQQAAIQGPVIIVNASKYGCDGLIILHDQDPIHVPLQISETRVDELSLLVHSLLHEEWRVRVGKRQIFGSRGAVSSLTRMLQELWTGVVAPIVAELERLDIPHQSRIWWCPTTAFVLLPLHAAGPYKVGKPNLTDLYISSYTLTLATLIRARQKRPSDPSPMEDLRFLAVAGGEGLTGVYTEVEIIGRLIQPPYAMPTLLKDEAADVKRVVEEMKQSHFVHFACHASRIRSRPFESSLVLADGSLKVEDIMREEMQCPQFAYLSACATSTASDEKNPDEAIHLAAVMQFTKFRSVVGTVWDVWDTEAVEVAKKFYSNMVDGSGHLDHTRAALALHESLKNANIPLGQRVLYVHFGA